MIMTDRGLQAMMMTRPIQETHRKQGIPQLVIYYGISREKTTRPRTPRSGRATIKNMTDQTVTVRLSQVKGQPNDKRTYGSHAQKVL